MKFKILILLLLININGYSGLVKPSIDVGEFIQQMDLRNKEFLNENYMKDNGIRKVYFRDKTLDSKYSVFNVGVTEFSYMKGENDKLDKYVYGESFLNCLSLKKIRINQFYDSDGNYINSDAFFFNFSDEDLIFNKNICKKEK